MSVVSVSSGLRSATGSVICVLLCAHGALACRGSGLVDLASIQNELAAAVDAAVEPEHVSVWLA